MRDFRRDLRMPAHCARISPAEQRALTGGGPVADAVGDFFDSLHLIGFHRGASVLSISFTFVPALLFVAVRSVFELGQELVDGIVSIFQQL